MRLAVRVYFQGILQSEERLMVTKDNLGVLCYSMAVKHAQMLHAELGHVEIEFLDELNPQERFFRIGTDTSGMVLPIAVKL